MLLNGHLWVTLRVQEIFIEAVKKGKRHVRTSSEANDTSDPCFLMGSVGSFGKIAPIDLVLGYIG